MVDSEIPTVLESGNWGFLVVNQWLRSSQITPLTRTDCKGTDFLLFRKLRLKKSKIRR